MNSERVPGSFRDPSGFVFRADGVCYRQINTIYRDEYDLLMASGLYAALVDAGLLLPHEDCDREYADGDDAYKVIRPAEVPFISYPYEWSFSQLKDAARLTLEIQRTALAFGMSLKDASAYNVQFIGSRPVFIDTLSFERYREGSPWGAYRQFCQHFLAPLALMAYRDVRMGQLLRSHIDGLPLDLASALLPLRTRLRPSLLMHVHLHAKTQARYAGRPTAGRERKISLLGLKGIIDSLLSSVGRLSWRPVGTEWGEYYDQTNYSETAADHKRTLVAEFLDLAAPKTVWDLGANTGVYSRVAAERGILTISFDIDPACVEKNYLASSREEAAELLPLLMDLTNPSSGIGWNGEERASLVQRGPTDTALALALVHHLAISNNVPLEKIADFLAGLCQWLIIEFIPKEDGQVQRLLASREDVFPEYTRESFEVAFGRRFLIERTMEVRDSRRTLYLMRRREEKR